jgi:hypothetical protein
MRADGRPPDEQVPRPERAADQQRLALPRPAAGRRASPRCAAAGSSGSSVSTSQRLPGPAQMRSKSALHAAIRQHQRAALVVNTRSRRGLRLYQAASSQLQAAGFDLLGSFPVHRPAQLDASLTTALDLRPDLLIVGGGDGSISLAARHLAYPRHRPGRPPARHHEQLRPHPGDPPEPGQGGRRPHPRKGR